MYHLDHIVKYLVEHLMKMVVVMLYLMENFFPNRAPTRFSFDFATRPPIIDGLILLYGRNTTPINDIFGQQLKFINQD
ncbi:unnamed protein product [Rotaria sp. Silwood2]|nr:unnamed protein product [Rotaria sp. Silwood2]